MKKHNESKSIKGIRHSKGKKLCKVISFAMVFVMLFCISASAEITTITVKDQNGNIININTDVQTRESLGNYKKIFYLQNYELKQVSYVVFNEINGNIRTYDLLSAEDDSEGKITIRYLLFANMNNIKPTKIENKYTGEIIIELDEENGITYEVVKEKWIEMVQQLQNNNFTEYITIKPPAYEGFIGNARGLFDMLFESIQSIFNWLVSPNVIVFFGLGIILSLSTIGILITKRFFWGR